MPREATRVPESLAGAVADASSGRVALVEAVLGEIGRSILKLSVFAPTAPPKQPPLAPRRWVTLWRPGNGTSRACFSTSLRASPLRAEVPQPSGAIVVVGQKSVTQDVFPQPPRRCSGASAASLALGRGLARLFLEMVSERYTKSGGQ